VLVVDADPAWGLIGAVSAVLAKRALTAVKRYSEDLDEPSPERLRLAA
jgi:hypothetical protein